MGKAGPSSSRATKEKRQNEMAKPECRRSEEAARCVKCVK